MCATLLELCQNHLALCVLNGNWSERATEITREILNSLAYVLLVTPQSVKRRWVNFEIRVAHDLSNRLREVQGISQDPILHFFPCRFGDFDDYPREIVDIQYGSFSASYDPTGPEDQEVLRQLVERIAKLCT